MLDLNRQRRWVGEQAATRWLGQGATVGWCILHESKELNFFTKWCGGFCLWNPWRFFGRSIIFCSCAYIFLKVAFKKKLSMNCACVSAIDSTSSPFWRLIFLRVFWRWSTTGLDDWWFCSLKLVLHQKNLFPGSFIRVTHYGFYSG